jgi:hypothetical protein
MSKGSRVYRANSWLRRAEESPLSAEDRFVDDRFIALWVAFNALYGQADAYLARDTWAGELKDIRDFLTQACSVNGAERRLVRALEGLADDVQTVRESPFLYSEYWQDGFTDQLSHTLESIAPTTPRSRKELVQLLKDVFERIYVLRNQIFHGSAKYGSGANRDTMEPAFRILLRRKPCL